MGRKQSLERQRLKESGSKFVELYPQYMHKARSNAHAKFLLGQKGGEKMADGMLKRYSRQCKLRENSEKYYEFKKDGYMESVPYQNEMQVRGSKIFEHRMAEGRDKEIGVDIATQIMVNR